MLKLKTCSNLEKSKLKKSSNYKKNHNNPTKLMENLENWKNPLENYRKTRKHPLMGHP
jgi:hypothetical protein